MDGWRDVDHMMKLIRVVLSTIVSSLFEVVEREFVSGGVPQGHPELHDPVRPAACGIPLRNNQSHPAGLIEPAARQHVAAVELGHLTAVVVFVLPAAAAHRPASVS